VIFTFGASALIPGDGFRDIYTGKTIFSSFARLTLIYCGFSVQVPEIACGGSSVAISSSRTVSNS